MNLLGCLDRPYLRKGISARRYRCFKHDKKALALIRNQKIRFCISGASNLVWRAPTALEKHRVAHPVHKKFTSRSAANALVKRWAMVGLADRAETLSLPQMSGGQQQRVAIARALVKSSHSILLAGTNPPEISTPIHRWRSWTFFQKLNDNGSDDCPWSLTKQDVPRTSQKRILIFRDGKIRRGRIGRRPPDGHPTFY